MRLFHELALAVVLMSLLALLLPVSVALADSPPLEEWTRTYGGPATEYFGSAQQTSDGGYAILGATASYGAGDFDVLLIKTDSSGNQLWSKTFGGPAYDYYQRGGWQQTSDGGYIIPAVTESYGAGEADIWLIKTDSSGNEQWNRTFGGPEIENQPSVQQTSDGGYILAGRTHSYGAGDYDVWLIRTDPNGNQLWSKTFGGPAQDQPGGVTQTLDGGYIILGYTHSYGAGIRDLWLIKTDSSGNEQWNRTYGGSGYDEGWEVRQTSDGGYILAGGTSSFEPGYMQVYLIKTDSSGNELWSRTFGGPGQATSVEVAADGGYVIAGLVSAGPDDALLVGTDSDGNELWRLVYPSGRFWSVQRTWDGGYVAGGETGNDLLVVKLAPPPPNTPVGSNVSVSLSCGQVVFNTVSAEGFTTCTSQQGNPAGGIPSGFRVRGLFIDITTTAAYSGAVTVCIPYDPSIPNPQNLKLFHWNGTGWGNVTTSIDPATNTICGQVSGLSPFFVGEEVAQTAEGCFIATAAYGSYLDSHVQTLRDFRDSYMATNPVGRNLVSAYYKLSPPLAQFIDGHPTLKPIVRVGLLPAMGISTVAVSTTMAEKIGIVGSVVLVSFLMLVWLRRSRQNP